jgi:hypothetical protein
MDNAYTWSMEKPEHWKPNTRTTFLTDSSGAGPVPRNAVQWNLSLVPHVLSKSNSRKYKVLSSTVQSIKK